MKDSSDKKTPPMDRLLAVMAKLRDPKGGCPWDVEQTFATIAPHTIEEAYEVADAIERNDLPALQDELGDLLLQVVFHARIAEEAGHFDFPSVAEAISEKLVRRHPHVFGDAHVESAAAQTIAWEALKAEERGRAKDGVKEPPSALEGVALALPALLRAQKLQKRAARVGFDWPDALPVFDKIAEESEEIKKEIISGDVENLESEIGDLLFSCVNLARKLNIDPEGALRRANTKFERRFRRVEGLLAAQGQAPQTAGLDIMDRLWEQAKTEESR